MVSSPENTSEQILRYIVTDSFKQRFQGEGYLQIASWNVEFPSLDELSTSILEASFEEDEIYLEIREADGDKSSGPNGFSFKFVHTFWAYFQA